MARKDSDGERVIRMQVDAEALKQEAPGEVDEQPEGNDGYMPLLRVPNKLRRLFGYTAHTKSAGSAF